MKKNTILLLVTLLIFGSFTTTSFAQTYTVQSGDALWKIAENHDVTIDSIVQNNNLSNPDLLYVGQVLSVGDESTQEKIIDNLATSGAKISKASLENPLTDSVPEGFRVTVIGSGLPVVSLDQLGPSILVEYKDSKFLVDCGYESMTGLMRAGLQPEEITNMLFTHQHSDHNTDFWTFLMGGWDARESRSELTLVGPSVQKLYDVTVGFFEEDIDYRINVTGSSPDGIRSNIDIYDFDETTEMLEIDGVKITAIEVPHTITTYAYKFEAGGETVVITGDMTNNEQIKSFSQGADIMVVDALLAADFSHLPAEYGVVLKQQLSNSHARNEDLANILNSAQPKNVVLVHWSGDIILKDTVDLYRAAGYEGEIIKGIDNLVVLP